jgi:hypothetical protein
LSRQIFDYLKLGSLFLIAIEDFRGPVYFDSLLYDTYTFTGHPSATEIAQINGEETDLSPRIPSTSSFTTIEKICGVIKNIVEAASAKTIIPYASYP